MIFIFNNFNYFISFLFSKLTILLLYNSLILSVYNRIIPIYRKLGVKIVENLTLDSFRQAFTDKYDVIILFTHWQNEISNTIIPISEYSKIISKQPELINIIGHSTELIDSLNLTYKSSLKPSDCTKEISIYLHDINNVYINFEQVLNNIKYIENGIIWTILCYTNASKIEYFDSLHDLKEVISCIPDDFSGILDLNVCHPDLFTILLRKLKSNCNIKYKDDVENQNKLIGVKPDYMLHFYNILFQYLNENDSNYFDAVLKISNLFINKKNT
jgi:hypothetical protein